MIAQRNGKLSVQVFRVLLLNLLLFKVSPFMERVVLDQLVDYFKTRLAGYPTTLSEDESMLSTLVSLVLPSLNNSTRLEHPWIKDGNAPDKPIDSAVLSKMKKQ
ncbi:hypothetical protein ACSQ67_001045 [Phaseolus vulgaris]